MKAEIITIGDEILIGQITDTNSAYIAGKLNEIGISVFQMTSIQDDREHILQALKEAEERVQVVILTGGLGPTRDDITKETLCSFTGDTLVEDTEVLAHIKALFEKYVDAPFSDLNRQQALVPSRSEVLHNQYGTAPGMWMTHKDVVYVSLPGVPFEMRALMTKEVLPRLQSTFHRPVIVHKTLLTYGIAESALANTLSSWETDLPAHMKLAYLPNLGKVRLRITAKGEDKQVLLQEVMAQFQKIMPVLGDAVTGFEEESPLEVVIGKKLTALSATLAVAESCTGGKLASRITAVPGASAYFMGGVVSYATAVKVSLLKVPEALIGEYSVVSGEVAEAMARGAQQRFDVDYAIATTGNAGPDKGESDAEVGTVFLAIATRDQVYSREFNFGNHREKVVNKAVNKALEMLRKEISKK